MSGPSRAGLITASESWRLQAMQQRRLVRETIFQRWGETHDCPGAWRKGRLPPAENAEGEGEREAGVGGQEGKLRPEGHERLAFEHDAAQRLIQRRQRQEVDQRLDRLGES